jgi:hypothetical protein
MKDLSVTLLVVIDEVSFFNIGDILTTELILSVLKVRICSCLGATYRDLNPGNRAEYDNILFPIVVLLEHCLEALNSLNLEFSL